jgi:hypothetical protein
VSGWCCGACQQSRFTMPTAATAAPRVRGPPVAGSLTSSCREEGPAATRICIHAPQVHAASRLLLVLPCVCVCVCVCLAAAAAGLPARPSRALGTLPRWWLLTSVLARPSSMSLTLSWCLPSRPPKWAVQQNACGREQPCRRPVHSFMLSCRGGVVPVYAVSLVGVESCC